MLCLIDNYDSFTYNVAHYVEELGVDVRVIRNDEMSVQEVLDLRPSHLLLSPGPGTPDESGISKELTVAAARAGIPVFGVCLGHQIIAQVFGASVSHARRVMHGKASTIQHDGSALYAEVPPQFLAARYHSLIVRTDGFPDCLSVSAWTTLPTGQVDEVMGLAHRQLPIFGVQFHPESIMTEHGHRIIANFLNVGCHGVQARTPT